VRVLPKDIARQHHRAAEQREPLVEEPARDQKQDRARHHKKDDRHQRDHLVADIDRIARHREVGAHRKQRDRIDERRGRCVVGIGPNFCGHVLAVALQLFDSQRPRKLRFPEMAVQHLAPDLRLIHRLRGGEATKFVQQIKERQPDYQSERERAADPNCSAPRFKRVDHALDRVSATGHGRKNPKKRIIKAPRPPFRISDFGLESPASPAPRAVLWRHFRRLLPPHSFH